MARDIVNVVEDDQRPKSCAYCHDEIKAEQDTVACQQCGTAYHKVCWEEIGRCGAHGCGNQSYDPIVAPPLEISIAQPVVAPLPIPPAAIEPDNDIMEQITITPGPNIHSPVISITLPDDEFSISEWEIKLGSMVKRAKVERALDKVGLRQLLQQHIQGKYYLIAQGVILTGAVIGALMIAIIIFSLLIS